MVATVQTGPGRLMARRFALLAVLMGLLAMHGVAMSHHAAASPPAASVAAHASTTTADHHDVASPAVASGTALLAAADPTCDEDCHAAVAMLCLAVMTTTALGALVTRRRGPLVAWWSTGRPRAPARRGPLLPAVDPVAELCVSRT